MPVSPICSKIVVSHAIKPQGGSGFNQVLQATLNQKAGPPLPTEVAGIQNPSPVQRIVTSITRSEDRLRDLVQKSLSGTANYSQEKLLVMQDSVYKATFVFDVVAKSVEQTTSGIKTLMQSQI